MCYTHLHKVQNSAPRYGHIGVSDCPQVWVKEREAYLKVDCDDLETDVGGGNSE